MDWITGLLGLLVGWFGASMLEYFKAKGKNLADKEDIRQLTELVEDVKQENAVLLEQVRERQQLRMAAAERRLQAHQDAFTLWRKLLMSAHTPECGQAVMECQDWWDRNCLFLSPEARTAFTRSFHAASTHAEMLKARVESRYIMGNWDLIMEAGSAIVRGADLPSLGPLEAAEAPDAFGKRVTVRPTAVG